MKELKLINRNTKTEMTKIRENNFIPGVVFGPSVKSRSIKMNKKDLKKALGGKGEIYKVESTNGAVFVKFDEVQRDSFSQKIIHFSLLELPKGELSEVDIPLSIKGETAGAKFGGVVMLLKESLLLEGKPSALPTKVEIDISKLNINDNLKVSDIELPKGISCKDDSDEVIVLCQPPVKVPVTNDSDESVETTTEIEFNEYNEVV